MTFSQQLSLSSLQAVPPLPTLSPSLYIEGMQTLLALGGERYNQCYGLVVILC